METKGIYLTDPDTATAALDRIKSSGGTRSEDSVIRTIMLTMSEYEEGWVPLKDGQQDAWVKLQEGLITKALLDRARRSMVNEYGLLLSEKKKTTFYLKVTPLGSEFLTWLLSDEAGIRWGNMGMRSKDKPTPSARIAAPKKPAAAEDSITLSDYEQLKKDLNFPEVPQWGLILDEPVPWNVYRHMDEVYIQSKGMRLAIVPGDCDVAVIENLAEPNDRGKTKVPHLLEKWTDIREDRIRLLDEVERLRQENEDLRMKLDQATGDV